MFLQDWTSLFPFLYAILCPFDFFLGGLDMESVGAVVFLPRDHANEMPLLLEKLLFSPGAVWLCEALKSAGVGRFLVVCHDDDREAAAACFPADTEFVTTGADDAGAKLSAFLTREPGKVVVVTRPVLLAPDGLNFLPAGQSPKVETGMYCMSTEVLAADLAAGEDFAGALKLHGGAVSETCAMPLQSRNPAMWRMYQGQAQVLEVSRLERMGARFIDPGSFFSDPTVRVGKGTVILPGTILRGKTTIGADCEIGPNSMIQDCVIGDGVTVNASQLNESTVADRTKVGPFAYVRPHCHVGADVKVGDFVELKNSTIGDGTKISHLTYVGDSDVGDHVNFGCGTVTVNYDGTAKYRTTIGDHAFIGCNTNLVGPVKIGDRAYTAAGSTVTEDVPADSLCIARSPQTIKVQWAAKRRRAKGRK